MSQSERSALRARLLTFLIVASSSILFCSKGVVAKLAYAHGVDALTVLTLRMGFALPFFVVLAVWFSRRAPRLTGPDWARLAGLGFLEHACLRRRPTAHPSHFR